MTIPRWGFLAGILVAVCLLAPATGCAQPSAAQTERVDFAVSRSAGSLAEGDDHQAYFFLELAMRQRENATPEQLVRMAELAIQLGSYPRAVEAAEQAFKLYAADPAAGSGTAAERVPPKVAGLLGEARFLASVGTDQPAAVGSTSPETMLRTAWSEPPYDEAGYWLARYLLAGDRAEEARKVLDAYRSRVPAESRVAGTDGLAQCLANGWLWPASGAGEAATPLLNANSQGVEPPVKTRTPLPRYSAAAYWEELEGGVILAMVVGPDGIPLCTRALTELPLGLTESALDVAAAWRFEPARFAGEPIPVRYNLTVQFKLSESEASAGKDLKQRLNEALDEAQGGRRPPGSGARN